MHLFKVRYNIQRFFCHKETIYVIAFSGVLIRIPFCLNCLHASFFCSCEFIAASISYKDALSHINA